MLAVKLQGLERRRARVFAADEYLVLKDKAAAAKKQSVPDFLWHLERFEPFGTPVSFKRYTCDSVS